MKHKQQWHKYIKELWKILEISALFLDADWYSFDVVYFNNMVLFVLFKSIRFVFYLFLSVFFIFWILHTIYILLSNYLIECLAAIRTKTIVLHRHNYITLQNTYNSCPSGLFVFLIYIISLSARPWSCS